MPGTPHNIRDISDLRGKKFVMVIRTSTEEQAARGVPQQRDANQAFADQHGLVIMDIVELPGFSATAGDQLDTFRTLVQRKLDGEQFDGILAQNWGRIARDQNDGNGIYALCYEAELLIVTRKDGLLHGRHSWIKRGLANYEEEGYVASLSSNSNRGRMASTLSGRMPHMQFAPLGVDRRVEKLDGTAVCIVRRTRDGETLRLAPNPPHEVEARFPKTENRPIRVSADERMTFVPGDAEHVNLVRRIFHLYYHDEQGYHLVAQYLNDAGIPSPRKGSMWHKTSVRAIVENTTYLGFGVACRFGSGRHSIRSADGPIEFAEPRPRGFHADGSGKARRRPALMLRDSEEWVVIKYPAMEDFLPDETKRLALAAFERRREESRSGAVRAKRGKRRYASAYFLSKILKTVGGHPMIGVPTCRPAAETTFKYRYYWSSSATSCPKSGCSVHARIAADLIERVVLNEMSEVLRSLSALDKLLSKFISEKNRKVVEGDRKRVRLLAEKQRAESEYLDLHASLGKHGKRLFKQKADELEARLEKLEEELVSFDARTGSEALHPSSVATSLKKQMAVLTEMLPSMAPAAVRRLAEALIDSLIYDPRTRTLDLTFRLPAWAVAKRPALLEHVRLADRTAINSAQETNIGIPLVRSTFDVVPGARGRQMQLVRRHTLVLADQQR